MSIFGVGPSLFLSGVATLTFMLVAQYHGIALAMPESWRVGRLLLAAALGLVGVAFWLGAVAGIVRARRRKTLVTDGVYRFSRNPLYAAFILFAVPALALFVNNLLVLVASPVMYVVFTLRIGREEEWLCAEFGAEYERYSRKVSRLLSL